MARRSLFLAVVVAALMGCGSSRPSAPKNLPTATASTSLGPGDIFEVFVLGESNIPKEFRVQPDGTINFPYLNKVVVAGLEPYEVVDLLTTRLKEAKILSDPQISVVIKGYSSKKVTIIGQVTKPGNLAFTDGMKLVEAISLAGWFTPLADSDHVILTRQASKTKVTTSVVSVDAITDGQQADIPLQAGDTIKVEQRLF